MTAVAANNGTTQGVDAGRGTVGSAESGPVGATMAASTNADAAVVAGMSALARPDDVACAAIAFDAVCTGATVGMRTAADDGINREMHGFRVVPYDIPQGCLGGYYPECNALIPLWQHAEDSMVPAAKSVPVRVLAAGDRP